MGHSDLLCRGPQLLSPLETPMAASTAAVDPLQISQVFAFADTSHLSPCWLPTCAPSEPGICSSSPSRPLCIIRCQLRSLRQTPSPLSLASSAHLQPRPLQLRVGPDAALSSSVTGLHRWAHLQLDPIQLFMCMPMA